MLYKAPKQRRREAKEKSILDMAMRLILENGLDGFSINRLAHELDYTPGALYRYYDSRDAIIAELEVQVIADFKEYFLILADEARKVKSELYPVLLIYLLAELYRQVSILEPAKYFLITALVADSRILVNDLDAARVMTEVALLMAEVAGVFFQAQEQGMLTAENSAERAVVYLGALQGVLQLNKLKRIDSALFDIEKLYSTTVRTLLTGWGLKGNIFDELVVLSRKVDIEKTIIDYRGNN